MSRSLPFHPTRSGPAVAWPERTGPSGLEIHRHDRPRDLWEKRTELAPGETVLADLGPRIRPIDACRILARYFTVRVVLHATESGQDTFLAADLAAARDHLGMLPRHCPERRWLGAVLTSVVAGEGASAATVSRLAAAAAAASRRGHPNGAFSLWKTGWDLATSRRWHVQAGRIAAAIAGAAGQAGARRSSRLWARRARVQLRRALG
jgi:hypothetical protein